MGQENPGSEATGPSQPSHSANRIAPSGVAASVAGGATVISLVQVATAKTGGQRLQHASALLQDAVEELETVAASTSDGGERADLYEAIGAIVDGLRMIAAANAGEGRGTPE